MGCAIFVGVQDLFGLTVACGLQQRFSRSWCKESQLPNPGELPLYSAGPDSAVALHRFGIFSLLLRWALHRTFCFCGGIYTGFPASAVGFLHRLWSSLNLRICIDFSAFTSSLSLTARFLQVNQSLEIYFLVAAFVNFYTVDVLNFAGPDVVHYHFHSDLGLQQVLHWHI